MVALGLSNRGRFFIPRKYVIIRPVVCEKYSLYEEGKECKSTFEHMAFMKTKDASQD